MCLEFIKKLLKNNNENSYEDNNSYNEIFNNDFNNKQNQELILYVKKPLLTNNEKSFYDKLKPLNEEYIVIPQVNLATVINKLSNQKYQNELYRNIDFGIFNKNLELQVLIELNDQSHKEKQRQARDFKVKEICEKANIPIITFWTNMPNEQDYIINRIKKTIKDYYSSNLTA